MEGLSNKLGLPIDIVKTMVVMILNMPLSNTLPIS